MQLSGIFLFNLSGGIESNSSLLIFLLHLLSPHPLPDFLLSAKHLLFFPSGKLCVSYRVIVPLGLTETGLENGLCAVGSGRKNKDSSSLWIARVPHQRDLASRDLPNLTYHDHKRVYGPRMWWKDTHVGVDRAGCQYY